MFKHETGRGKKKSQRAPARVGQSLYKRKGKGSILTQRLSMTEWGGSRTWRNWKQPRQVQVQGHNLEGLATAGTREGRGAEGEQRSSSVRCRYQIRLASSPTANLESAFNNSTSFNGGRGKYLMIPGAPLGTNLETVGAFAVSAIQTPAPAYPGPPWPLTGLLQTAKRRYRVRAPGVWVALGCVGGPPLWECGLGRGSARKVDGTIAHASSRPCPLIAIASVTWASHSARM